MMISNNGIDLIKQFESLRLKAYLCPAGKWTIGYGHTRNVKEGDVINSDTAEKLLRADLVGFEKDVNRLIKVNVTQNQFDALISLVFNIGARAFSTSTLLRLLNQGEYTAAANQFIRWKTSNGKELLGLVRRRRAEMELFLK